MIEEGGRIGGPAPLVALGQWEEVTAPQLRLQRAINAGESAWERRFWEDDVCHLVLHS